MAYCTPEEALSLTGKVLTQAQLDSAQLRIEDHTGFAWETKSVAGEIHSGEGGAWLFPKKAPVTSVSAITIDDSSIDITLFEVDSSKNGIYYSSGWNSGRNNIEIDYSYGFSEISQQIKEATARLAIILLANPAMLSSQSAGKWSAQYGIFGIDGFLKTLKSLPRRRPV